jgi:hypothetical protein
MIYVKVMIKDKAEGSVCDRFICYRALLIYLCLGIIFQVVATSPLSLAFPFSVSYSELSYLLYFPS